MRCLLLRSFAVAALEEARVVSRAPCSPPLQARHRRISSQSFACTAPLLAESSSSGVPTSGDWVCPCGFRNFAFRTDCFHCHQRNPIAPGAGRWRAAARRSERRPDAGGDLSSPGQRDPAAVGGVSPQPYKNGDWTCQCGAHNFARRTACITCHRPRTARTSTPFFQSQRSDAPVGSHLEHAPPRETGFAVAGGGGGYGRTPGRHSLRPGDWLCPSCLAHNFRSRERCYTCGEEKRQSAGAPTRVAGCDWVCAACHTPNTSSTAHCAVCGSKRAAHGAESRESLEDPAASHHNRPGYVPWATDVRPEDWSCPMCAFFNFGSRVKCKMCKSPKPEDSHGSGGAGAGKDTQHHDSPPASLCDVATAEDEDSDEELARVWICECGYKNYATRPTCHEKALLQSRYEEKRAFLSTHLGHLCANTNPTTLWSSIVRHHATQGGDKARERAATPRRRGDDGGEATVTDSYDDLYLSFDGFRAVAYEILFQTTMEKNAESPAATQAERKRLFFSHPFLSPATFLGFARSDAGTVPAVPLYAFVAKRLLLFRLRVELELVATAVPPLFRSSNGGARGLPTPSSPSSPLSNGLSQEDLEAFIGDLVPNLRLVRDMPPWMLPYYLCHASRKFFFMCDTHHVGVLSIDTVMKSDVFSELLRLFESDPRDAFTPYPESCPVEVSARLFDPAAAEDDTVPGTVVSFDNEGTDAEDVYTIQAQVPPAAAAHDNGTSSPPRKGGAESGHPPAQTVRVRRDEVYYSAAAAEFLDGDQLSMDNWFSLPLMCRIYEHFTSLDQDEDGVLTVDELAHYSGDSFTRLAVERVFECHVPHSGNKHIMDYKTYLNFVIATEHAATRPAMKYIWSILDLGGTRDKIHIPVLHCFCRELAKELAEHGLMLEISAQSILSEVVDMINPEWHEWVTLEDVERSGQQATVLPILLSYRNFFAYDCREQTAAASSDEYTDPSA